MFFEPKPEFSSVVRGGYNCRAFSPVRNIGNQTIEASYTPPLVKVITGLTIEEVEGAYEAFVSTRGIMALAISPVSIVINPHERGSGSFYLTVIYQESVQHEHTQPGRLSGLDDQDRTAPEPGGTGRDAA